MPRSGSTLLESILSLNNEVYDLGESEIFEESFLEYKDSTHRRNPLYTRNNATNKAIIKKFKSKLISRSNISLVNTSCIHRENKKT